MNSGKDTSEAAENRLVEQFRKGNLKAFHTLFDLLFPVLCSFAGRYLPNTEAPEDVVQDAFIAVWEKHSAFNGITHLKAFLYETVRNKCLNRIRHLEVRENYRVEQQGDSVQSDFFEQQLLQAEVLLNLKKAIDHLPRQQRKIILLSRMGYGNDEVAGLLDISVNTVKLQKKIAYEKLRNWLNMIRILGPFF